MGCETWADVLAKYQLYINGQIPESSLFACFIEYTAAHDADDYPIPASSYNLFPSLPGLSWSVKRIPQWRTIVQENASGMEVAAGLMAYPLWIWELTYDLLKSATIRPGQSYPDLQILLAFFNSQYGRIIPFLYEDSLDKAVFTQIFGTGDGSTTTFQLMRQLGGFYEPVFAPHGSVFVYHKEGEEWIEYTGTTDFTIDIYGLVTFETAPADGLQLAWSGMYYWLARFLEDASNFENFMNNLWQNKQITFRSVKV